MAVYDGEIYNQLLFRLKSFFEEYKRPPFNTKDRSEIEIKLARELKDVSKRVKKKLSLVNFFEDKPELLMLVDYSKSIGWNLKTGEKTDSRENERRFVIRLGECVVFKKKFGESPRVNMSKRSIERENERALGSWLSIQRKMVKDLISEGQDYDSWGGEWKNFIEEGFFNDKTADEVRELVSLEGDKNGRYESVERNEGFRSVCAEDVVDCGRTGEDVSLQECHDGFVNGNCGLAGMKLHSCHKCEQGLEVRKFDAEDGSVGPKGVPELGLSKKR